MTERSELPASYPNRWLFVVLTILTSTLILVVVVTS